MSVFQEKAVFLSYASQDAEAVRRIAEALRAAGVEVWFDQNELVGGDAWDAKIRKQIKECALFVPVISANTEARTEGYFRLEWRLGDQRTHLMAKGRPFLLPVVIDDTRDTAAHVPDSFTEVQWTRLSQGDSVEKFCARVKRLLGESAPAPGGFPRDRNPGEAQLPQPKGHRIRYVAALAGLAFAVSLGGVAIWRPWKWVGAAATAPLSEARQIVAQARALFDSGDYVNREDVFLAEDLLKKAQTLDSTDAEVWAAQADLSRQMIILGYQRSSARFELLRQQSERAFKLDPHSVASRISYAGYLQWAGKESARESVRMMEALLVAAPDNRKAYRVLGMSWSYAGEIDQTMAALRRSNALPGGDPVALMMGAAQLQWWGRYAEQAAMLEQADAVGVTGRSHLLRVLVELFWHGDLDGAAAALEKWPVWMQREDRGAFVASQVWLWRREPERAIAVLAPMARDAFFDTYYTGPKAVLVALAHEMAGRPQAARAEWETARRVAARMVEEQPSLKRALTLKAVAMAKLGETAEAEAVLRRLEESGDLHSEYWSSAHPSALLRLSLGHADQVADRLSSESMVDAVSRPFPAPRAALLLNPVYDSIRATPGFQRLLAAAPAPTKKQAAAPPAAGLGVSDKSLVVLPLENLSPDPENAYFTEGMHAEIIATLQRTTDLRVIGRDTALVFKRGSATVADFARRVGAVNVLSGSVRRSGNKVRILFELRRASDDAVLWTSPDTERELTDIWAVQSELAEHVARALRARESAGSNAHARILTKNPRAFDLFLKGDQQFFAAAFDRSIPLYAEAFALDPAYVVPPYMLAHAHCNLFYAESEPAARVRYAQEARKWIGVVTRLDPNGFGAIAESHYASSVEEDNLRALELAERGMRALPNENAAPTFHALALEGLGRISDALDSYHRATQIDPLLVFSLQNEARALGLLRRDAEASLLLERITEVAGANRTFDRASHALAVQRFRLRGTLPGAIAAIPLPHPRAVWAHRARQFAEAEQAAASAASLHGSNDAARFELLALRHDALLRLQRRPEAGEVASELMTLALKLQTAPEIGTSRRAGWLAVAEARVGRAEEAIAAGRRFVSDAAPGRQQALRWNREIALAELYAFLHRPRECVELLEKLLRVPSGLTVPMLRVDPIWDNVREEAAFKALLADPKNSAPL